jgi:hypothetical protein
LSYGWEIRGKRSSGKTGRSGMRDTGKEQGDPEWRPRRDIGRFGRERRNRAEIYGDPGKKRPERGGGGERYKEIRNIKLLHSFKILITYQRKFQNKTVLSAVIIF